MTRRRRDKREKKNKCYIHKSELRGEKGATERDEKFSKEMYMRADGLKAGLYKAVFEREDRADCPEFLVEKGSGGG